MSQEEPRRRRRATRARGHESTGDPLRRTAEPDGHKAVREPGGQTRKRATKRASKKKGS